MADIIPFPARRKKSGTGHNKTPGSGKTLCKSGFHKWSVDQRKQFDVKQGRLVTIRRCTRCNVTRTTLD